MNILENWFKLLEGRDGNKSQKVLSSSRPKKKIGKYTEKVRLLCPDLDIPDTYSEEFNDVDLMKEVIESDFGILDEHVELHNLFYNYFYPEKLDETNASQNEKNHISSIQDSVDVITNFLCDGRKYDSDNAKECFKRIINCSIDVLKRDADPTANTIATYLKGSSKNRKCLAAESIYFIARYAMTHTIPYMLIQIGRNKYDDDLKKFVYFFENNIDFNFSTLHNYLYALAYPIKQPKLNNTSEKNYTSSQNSLALAILALIEIYQNYNTNFRNANTHIPKALKYINDLQKININFPVPFYLKAQLLYDYVLKKNEGISLSIKEIDEQYNDTDVLYKEIIELAKKASSYSISNANCLLGDIFDNPTINSSLKDNISYNSDENIILQKYELGQNGSNVISAYKRACILEKQSNILDDEIIQCYTQAANMGLFEAIIRLIDIYGSDERYKNSTLCHSYILWSLHFNYISELHTSAIASRIIRYSSLISDSLKNADTIPTPILKALSEYQNHLTQKLIFQKDSVYREEIEKQLKACQETLISISKAS